MITLGTSHNTYSHFGGFENQIKKIKEHGYDCIDYQTFITTEGNPLFEQMDFSQFSAFLKAERDILDTYSVKVSQTHAPWRYPPKDSTEDERNMRLMHMRRAIEGTALLGCTRFVVHPLIPYSTEDTGYEKETLALNIPFLKALCEVADNVGVTVCLENMPMPSFSIATVPQILACIETVNAPNLKMCLDTGHVTMFGISPANAVRMIGKEKLAALHVHDNNGTFDEHLPPFEGIIDWPDFCKALAQIGFDGVFSFECSARNFPPEQMEQELITLKNKGDYCLNLIKTLRGDFSL